MTDACSIAQPANIARRGKRFSELVADAKTRIQEISIAELKGWQAQGKAFHLIDVREPSDYGDAHIAGSVSIPRGLLELALDDVIENQDASVVLYCGGGSRSALAADVAQQMGYTHVFSLAGGWRQWQQQS